MWVSEWQYIHNNSSVKVLPHCVPKKSTYKISKIVCEILYHFHFYHFLLLGELKPNNLGEIIHQLINLFVHLLDNLLQKGLPNNKMSAKSLVVSISSPSVMCKPIIMQPLTKVWCVVHWLKTNVIENNGQLKLKELNCYRGFR